MLDSCKKLLAAVVTMAPLAGCATDGYYDSYGYGYDYPYYGPSYYGPGVGLGMS